MERLWIEWKARENGWFLNMTVNGKNRSVFLGMHWKPDQITKALADLISQVAN